LCFISNKSTKNTIVFITIKGEYLIASISDRIFTRTNFLGEPEDGKNYENIPTSYFHAEGFGMAVWKNYIFIAGFFYSFRDFDFYLTGSRGMIWKWEDVSYSVGEKDYELVYPGCSLKQNYPNPFQDKTVISYQLPIAGQVDLSVYNLLGQKIKTLVYEKQQPGSYNVQWETNSAKLGIYINVFEVDGKVSYNKMIQIE